MRRCSVCKRRFPDDEFPLRKKGGTRRQPYCKQCKAAYQRRWYEQHRERHLAAVLANKRERRKRNYALINAAKSVPCADCGRTYSPYVMDFDHAHGAKTANISELARAAAPLAVLVAEIAKCDIVCANCHRERTYGRDPERQGA
jgi:hypothetical protein